MVQLATAATILSAPLDDFYSRATNNIVNARFHVPVRTAETLEIKLAPLIAQELTSTSAGTNLDSDLFGTVTSSNRATAIDTSRPAVYFERSRVALRGKPHDQLTYVWFYSATQPNASSGTTAQGVRITLNSRGQPIVWEVLSDRSGADLIFVSASMEAAALTEFGGPLPGRRFVTERHVKETPRTIVPRIIDDGPVPMGPILYLSSGTRDVSALACRCMEGQANNILETRFYDLIPLEKLSRSDRRKLGVKILLSKAPLDRRVRLAKRET